MQTVSPDYTSMALGSIRHPTENVLISWLKNYDPSIVAFTIGVSTIGGVDIIAGTGSNIAESDKFSYIDESEHVMLLEYERELIQPISSVTRAMADILLDNNTDRFTPGVDGTIGDYILPRRPIRLYLGFEINSLPEVVQIFVGEIAEFPEINRSDNLVRLHCRDFFETIWNFPLQNSVQYVNKRTDEVLSSLLQLAGLATNQSILDVGSNIIGFVYFDAGDKLGPIFQKLVEAELGRFYLDESGIYRFENRINWLNVTTPVLTLTTSMVIDDGTPKVDDIVNAVEITATPREVKDNQLIWQTSEPKPINPGETIEFFTDYDDPMFTVDLPTANGATSYYAAYTFQDYSGDDLTANISRDSWTDFSRSSKAVFTNNGAVGAYLTVVLWGAPARITSNIFIRHQDATSVDTYGEHVVKIDNEFIQDTNFAQAIAQIIVSTRGNPGDYREITILGYPPLQLGDLISWQSTLYNVIRIRGRLSGAEGLTQQLTLIKRVVQTYFEIGTSTIGSTTDVIAP